MSETERRVVTIWPITSAAYSDVKPEIIIISNNDNDNEMIYSIDETMFFLQKIHISGDLIMVIVDCC